MVAAWTPLDGAEGSVNVSLPVTPVSQPLLCQVKDRLLAWQGVPGRTVSTSLFALGGQETGFDDSVCEFAWAKLLLESSTSATWTQSMDAP